MPTTGVPVPVHGIARADVETAFEVIVPIDLPRIFRGFGPLPAVVATAGQTGGWDHVGASRVVKLSDGRDVNERITAYDRPRYFAYRVGPFEAGPLRHLVVEADGEWWFTARGATSTAIRWTYTFRPRRYAAPFVRLLIARLWRGYAKRALALAIDEVEQRQP
jgi:polyketide cyclase/dehydrase/lipid transport protein